MIVHTSANRVPTRVVVYAVEAQASIAGEPVVAVSATRNVGVEVFDFS